MASLVDLRYLEASPDATLEGPSSAPGKRTLTGRLQRRAAGTSAPPAAGGAAPPPAEGSPDHDGTQSFVDSLLAGSAAGALPYADRIQASFGHHDVSGIQAHTDGPARTAADGLGALAFATGDHVAFGGTPDLHTAAHEAAHVVQQRAGIHLKGGVGEDGDIHEQHADAVADAVVRGESAAPLLDAYTGGGGRAGIQRKGASAPDPDEQASWDLMQQQAEDHLLETIVYYGQVPHFRSASLGGRGPAQPRAQLSPEYHALAEELRAVNLIFIDDARGDARLPAAVDAWGAVKRKLLPIVTRAHERGSKRARAAGSAMATYEAHVLDSLKDQVIGEHLDGIDVGHPEAGYELETQRVVDAAVLETMALRHKLESAAARDAAKGGAGVILGELRNRWLSGAAAPFEIWYLLTMTTPELGERVKKAQQAGLLKKADTAADMLKYALGAAKATVSAVNSLAALVWPAAKAEVKDVFGRFAQLTAGDESKVLGNVIGKAIAIIEIVRGTIGLIDGIASGDLRTALKGAEKIAGGGVSLGMMAVGAGVGASAMAGGLVTIWFGTLNAILDVGALLRDARRLKMLDVTHDFVTRAAKLVADGTELVAARDAMLEQRTYVKDPAMQAELDERITDHMLALGAKLAPRLRMLGSELLADDKSSIGAYPQVTRGLGPDARQRLLNLSGGLTDEPMMIADHCLVIFHGIERMGRYAAATYGNQRDSKESLEAWRSIDRELGAEERAANP